MASGRTRASDLPNPLTVELQWGLGDVLLTTPALRAFKALRPDHVVRFRTRTQPRHSAYRSGAVPIDMIRHNPDIDEIVDSGTVRPPDVIDLRYAWFGGPSLDYPIQHHYFEQIHLDPVDHPLDSHYYIAEDETLGARGMIGDSPVLAIAPHNGWPGKLWRREAWWDVMTWAHSEGIRPVVLSGDALPEMNHAAALNLSGRISLRQAAAILSLADFAVLVEGGLSNLRFAIKHDAATGNILPRYRGCVLLTCATQAGVQVWTPPDLTTEVRASTPGGAAACDPCMWRGRHVQARNGRIPPASIRDCPEGRSLRDVPASTVITALSRQIEQREGVMTNG